MKAPYRSEVDALRERRESLEAEAAKLRERTSELDTLRVREKEIEAELASIEGRIGRRSLPLLEQVRVASPCNANWDEMLGDDRARFCLSCEKNVYNISAMPKEEAEAFLRERAGRSVCIRYFQRADGTILTEDCPVGMKKKRRKKLAIAVAGAGAMALAGASALLARTTCRSATMGEMAPPVAGGAMIPESPAPPDPAPEERMGDWAGPDVKAVPPPPPDEAKGRENLKR